MHFLATALLAAPLVQDFSIPNADFENASAYWGSQEGSTVNFDAESGPSSGTALGGSNLVAKFPGGAPQAIWRTVQLRGDSRLDPPPSPDHSGTKVEFGVWFLLAGPYHEPDDTLVLRVKSGEAVIAERQVFARDFPVGTWHHVKTTYDPAVGMDGCIRHGTSGLTVVIEVDAKGEVWVDEVAGRPFTHARWPVVDADFERVAALGTSWELDGSASIDASVLAYYGERSLVLRSQGRDSVVQRIESQVHGVLPQTGDVPEAGAWVRITHGDGNPSGSVRLQVWHEHILEGAPGTAPIRLETKLAEGRLRAADVVAGRWSYFETDTEEALAIPPRTERTLSTRVVVRIGKDTPRRVRVDYVQVGVAHSVDGNPKRFAYANYMARFRNPGFDPDPLVDAPSNGLGRQWKSWFWDRAPACDAPASFYMHDPTRLRSGSNPHDAGRRDLAVSAWAERPLPLLGAYDSRDPRVIELHVGLARAAGLDAFMLGWYGQKAVELDLCSPNLDSVNGPTLEQLYETIELLGSDLKVAVKLNLQRHLNDVFSSAPPGCPFPSENTYEKKRKGIRDDLIWLVRKYYSHRATLKRNGRMVVSVFDPERMFQDEHGIWTHFNAKDWGWIKDEVHRLSGHELELLFDNAPRLQDPVEVAGAWYEGVADGLASWRLVPCRLSLFADFEDFLAGNERFVTQEAVRVQFREQINGRPYRWWRQGDGTRLGIAIAYPGFDDTGVAGWGGLNGSCPGNGPRCARVVPASGLQWHVDCELDSSTCFLELALDEAVRSGMDWLQVPTWNDWNELTMIEPFYSAVYVDHVLSGAPTPGDHDREWVLGRLLETQRGLARFKATVLDPGEIDDIVEAFLLANAGTLYD